MIQISRFHQSVKRKKWYKVVQIGFQLSKFVLMPCVCFIKKSKTKRFSNLRLIKSANNIRIIFIKSNKTHFYEWTLKAIHIVLFFACSVRYISHWNCIKSCNACAICDMLFNIIAFRCCTNTFTIFVVLLVVWKIVCERNC